MSAPRLDIDLDKIEHNARTLLDRLAVRGISVMGITKSILGSADITRALLRAGMTSLGDARIDNIENLRRAHLCASMTLIRSPMLSQIDRVVTHTDISFNTELEIISRLSKSAVENHRTHGIVLMVELGDLREGIMPVDLVGPTTAARTACESASVAKGVSYGRSALSPQSASGFFSSSLTPCRIKHRSWRGGCCMIVFKRWCSLSLNVALCNTTALYFLNGNNYGFSRFFLKN